MPNQVIEMNLTERIILTLLMVFIIQSILSENLPTKRVKVWTNCGVICTIGTLIQKNLWVKSVMTPIILEKIESTII